MRRGDHNKLPFLFALQNKFKKFKEKRNTYIIYYSSLTGENFEKHSSKNS